MADITDYRLMDLLRRHPQGWTLHKTLTNGGAYPSGPSSIAPANTNNAIACKGWNRIYIRIKLQTPGGGNYQQRAGLYESGGATFELDDPSPLLSVGGFFEFKLLGADYFEMIYPQIDSGLGTVMVYYLLANEIAGGGCC